MRDKTEDHASLLAVNQQAQRDVVERNEEIDKLAGRIRELEQALLSSAESNRALSQLEQELHRAKQRELELTQVHTHTHTLVSSEPSQQHQGQQPSKAPRKSFSLVN